MYGFNSPLVPATPILGDTNDGGLQDDRKRRRWKFLMKTCDIFVNIIGVASLITMITVKTGLINVGGKEGQNYWQEVATQAINGAFTISTLVNNPYYLSHLIMTFRVLKASREQYQSQVGIQAVEYLSQYYPHVFIDATTVYNGDNLEGQVSTYSASSSVMILKPPVKTEEISRLGQILFLLNDVKHLRMTHFILNCGCLFQYIMSGFMWGFDAAYRPAFTIMFVVPAVLCGVIGQRRLKKLIKKSESRELILVDGIPVFRDIVQEN